MREHSEESVFVGNSLALSDSEISVLASKALKGNVEAAHRLANFYMVVGDNYSGGLYWLGIAAKFGDKSAEASLSKILSKIKLSDLNPKATKPE